MGFGQPKKFVPVNLTPGDSEGDQWALGMVHSIFGDVMSVMQTERSKQLKIGPSEIGDHCQKCLARKLSLLYPPELPGSDSWKAQIGTFGHAGLEEHFGDIHPLPWDPWESDGTESSSRFMVSGRDRYPATMTDPHYHLERKLHIRPWLSGSCDMYVEGSAPHGLVVDWKFQGANTLKKSGSGKLSKTYFVQMNTYGLGYELLGMPVSHLVLFALPRDDELNAARPVLMRYDRQVALDAIAECERLMEVAELVGWENLIDRLPSANDVPGADRCWDCPRFAAREERTFIDDLTG